MKRSYRIIVLVILSLCLTFFVGRYIITSKELVTAASAPELFHSDTAFDKIFLHSGSINIDNNLVESKEPQSITASKLGDPGLSFRHVKSLGEATVAFQDDSSHINNPWGLDAVGSHLWVAGADDLRVLQFSNTGAFINQYGKAGFRYGLNWISLEWISDVAVDSAGHIWIVDLGANHVVKIDTGGNLLMELGQTWNPGSDHAHFERPSGIAFDSSDNIYVSDGAGNVWAGSEGNHRIEIFDKDGNYLNTIGATGVSGTDTTHFNGQTHISIDSADHLYVADTINHRIQIFDVSNVLTPSFVGTLGVTGVAGSDNGHFRNPSGVETDGTNIYVADTWNHRVQIFNQATRTYIATLGTWGQGDYQFNTPSDVSIDNAGNLYVADSINWRVQQFSPTLVYQRTYGTTGVPYITDAYHYFRPRGIAVASDGSIYIGEERGRRLVKLDRFGNEIWTIGEPGVWGEDNAHFGDISDLAIDNADRIYVAEAINYAHSVQIYNSDGTYHATLGTGMGSGQYEFNSIRGITVDDSGYIYIADEWNHRVQIYDSSRSYVATLGVTGVPGSDNAHFNGPVDVTVDTAGAIYVVDRGTNRVQIYNASRQYIHSLGQATGCSGDFDSLCNPTAVVVDNSGRIYVADSFGDHIKVFDQNGGYLTSIGGFSGMGTGSINQSFDLALDKFGRLYIPDYLYSRVQVYAPGVIGWQQVNINGFGDNWNWSVRALSEYGDYLYAGIPNDKGAQVHRMNSSGVWTTVITDGFGTANNSRISRLLPFNGNLYASTANSQTGGEIWRSSNGLSWSQVISRGFGITTTNLIEYLGIFSDTLYATGWSRFGSISTGSIIWRSTTGDPGSWEKVVNNGFSDGNNFSIGIVKEINQYVYAGTWNYFTGGQLWRSASGNLGDWTQVVTDGFANSSNSQIMSLAYFRNYIYTGTRNYNTGGEIWRSANGTLWEKVVDQGMGDGNSNQGVDGLYVFDGNLYATIANFQTGLEVWSTGDGVNWHQVNQDGFGTNVNRYLDGDMPITSYQGDIYIGTTVAANGGQIWKMLNRVYVPVVLKNR